MRDELAVETRSRRQLRRLRRLGRRAWIPRPRHPADSDMAQAIGLAERPCDGCGQLALYVIRLAHGPRAGQRLCLTCAPPGA